MVVECRPCFAVDVLCALAHGKRCRGSIQSLKKTVSSICRPLRICPSDWSLCVVLAQHMLPDEMERMDLTDLLLLYIDWMEDSELISASRTDVAAALDGLREMDFGWQYRRLCLPVVDEWCERLNAQLSEKELNTMEQAVCSVRGETALDALRVYVSYFSYPNTFNLSDSLTVTSCRMGEQVRLERLLPRMIHELLHGQFGDTLLERYARLCGQDAFLMRTRQYQTDRYGSLAEEEFVSALSLFIADQSELVPPAEAYRRLSQGAGYSMPVAVLLYHALREGGVLPDNLDKWLYDCLDQIAGEEDLEAAVDEIIPGYTRNFEKLWKHEQPLRFRAALFM